MIFNLFHILYFSSCVKQSQCYFKVCDNDNDISIIDDLLAGDSVDDLIGDIFGGLGRRRKRSDEETQMCGGKSGDKRISRECGLKKTSNVGPRFSDELDSTVCCHNVRFSYFILIANSKFLTKNSF